MSADRTATLTGWGRTAATTASLVRPGSRAALVAAAAGAGPRGAVARGLGRSYGDQAQNAGGLVLDTGGLDQVLEVQRDGVTVTVEGGARLGHVMRVLQRRGLFPPVVPGTRQVSLGGMVAADVHGKNHHRDGSLGAHVSRLTLLTADGDVRDVGPEPGQDPEVFWATLGGLGLTGVVLELDVRATRVPSPWMSVDVTPAPDLDGVLAALAEADARRYSVAWLDCLAGGRHAGRGVVTSADHAPAAQVAGWHLHGGPPDADPAPRLAAPPWVPSGVLNRWSVAAVNAAWFGATRRRRGVRQSPAQFFHPLDSVSGWNRMYGRAGLVQYQCVVPDVGTLERVLATVRQAHAPVFLAVLKRFGAGNLGPLSFPRRGWTVSLDLPARAESVPHLLDRLDDTVAASGGSVYLAKDARLRPELLPAFYPRLDEWRELRARVDPKQRWQSDLSRRLGL
jgi:decaprenylphospho-beta-D-ribofuranose 2-oxidase